MHTAAENDNSMMGQVMRSIRKISQPAAHIVVHHARKSRQERRVTTQALLVSGGIIHSW
nr:hypothetical protein [Aeromonas caviae]